MNYVTLLGLFSGALTTVAFFPQVLKVWKTRSTRDISLLTFSIQSSGNFLWIVYGFFINDIPVMAANSVTCFFMATILIFKIKYH